MKFKQFAALPYRMRNDGIEILLITTRKKRRWSVPKGWPLKRKAPQQTAATEAYEEAGLQGAVGDQRIGQFRNRRLTNGTCAMCRSFRLQLRASRQNGRRVSEDESG